MDTMSTLENTPRKPGRPISVTYRMEDRGFATPCHIWQGAKTPTGYGMLKRGGYNGYTHRYFYELENGPIPEGFQLDHLCCQRDCMNPAHLEPVTPAVNVRRSALAKLTPTRVQAIRYAYSQRKRVPVRQWELAKAYGVTQAQISNIVNFKKWN